MPRMTKSRRRTVLALVGAATGFAASIAIATAFRPSATEEAAFCSRAASAPVTAVVVDSSDALAPKSLAMVRAAVKAAVVGERGARVVVARVNGAREYRPEILFNRCDPGTGEQANGNEGRAARDQLRDEEFLAPLELAIGNLAKPMAANDRSFLTDTLMHVVADPSMHLSGSNARILFLSDLIENTDGSKPFESGRIVLPDVKERFLAGISIEVIELPAMAEAATLQSYQNRSQWRSWLAIAGSPQVNVTAPGLAQDGELAASMR